MFSMYSMCKGIYKKIMLIVSIIYSLLIFVYYLEKSDILFYIAIL